mmetsp:Transcript_31634/g.69310  ORF Transcript_31634/g.69310 Transcript_31634/m.69310 type:complete len:242 (+) Transcript_31634:177-902(+)
MHINSSIGTLTNLTNARAARSDDPRASIRRDQESESDLRLELTRAFHLGENLAKCLILLIHRTTNGNQFVCVREILVSLLLNVNVRAAGIAHRTYRGPLGPHQNADNAHRNQHIPRRSFFISSAVVATAPSVSTAIPRVTSFKSPTTASSPPVVLHRSRVTSRPAATSILGRFLHFLWSNVVIDDFDRPANIVQGTDHQAPPRPVPIDVDLHIRGVLGALDVLAASAHHPLDRLNWQQDTD